MRSRGTGHQGPQHASADPQQKDAGYDPGLCPDCRDDPHHVAAPFEPAPAAAAILQKRMQQSPRHVRGPDCIIIDDLCDRVARLMQGSTTVIATRVAPSGGVPHWPERPGRQATNQIPPKARAAFAGR